MIVKIPVTVWKKSGIKGTQFKENVHIIHIIYLKGPLKSSHVLKLDHKDVSGDRGMVISLGENIYL